MRVITRFARAFGRFWWDFLVGDTPEIFLGTLAIVAVAFAVHRDRAVAVALVPLAVVGVLLASTFRGRQRA